MANYQGHGARLPLQETWDAFNSGEWRDLSGYEDGTENPIGDAVVIAAIVGAQLPALAGSSFVATQRWFHNFERFESMLGVAQPDTLYRCMDKLVAHKRELFSFLKARWACLFGACFEIPAV